MCIFIVVVFGATCFSRIPIDLMPSMNIPMAIVQTTYTGAGPYEVENLVTRTLESAVATVSNVKTISSNSSEGSSLIMIEFAEDTDMDFAMLQMREKIDLVKGALPSDAGTPMVVKMDPSMMPILSISVAPAQDSPAPADAITLKNFTETSVTPYLERIDGVASVSLSGGRSKEIRVDLKQDKMAGYALDANTIISILQAENLNQPGGTLEYGEKSLIVRTMGEFSSIEDLYDIPIPLKTGAIIRLTDVADVYEVYQDVSSISRLNGQDCVTLSVQKATGANTVGVVEAIQKEIAKINAENADIEVSVVFDQAEFIKQAINNLTDSAIYGGILAVLVLFLFLRKIKMSLIVGTAIPISVIATFIVMYFTDMTFNIISLCGLAMGIGMLVDNAIVVLENIFRKRSEGLSREDASLEGAREVTGPIIASTLTTVAVFLPIVFVEGFASQIFRDLSLTVTFSLLCSLAVALTVIPSLCSKFDAARLKPKKKNKNPITWILDLWGRMIEGLDGLYRKLLQAVLRHRWRTVIIAFIIFIASFSLLPKIGMELIPATDQGQISVSVSLPRGSQLAETDAVATQVETLLAEIPEVDKVITSVGSSGMLGGASGDSASMTVNLKALNQRAKSTAQVVEDIRARVGDIPGAEIEVTSQSTMSMGTGGISISISGDDMDTLQTLSEEVVRQISAVEGIRSPQSTFQQGKPEVRLLVDRQKAASFGLTGAQVASYLRIAMDGRVATTLKQDGAEIDIKVSLPKADKTTLQQLKTLTIQTPTGAFIPLSALVTTEQTNGNIVITRDNQQRYINVTADTYGRDLGSISQDVAAKLDAMTFPAGYTHSMGGDYETMMESFSSLFLALLLAIVLVYMIMAAQFESLLYPLIIMFSLPLAFTGSVLVMAVSGKTLNVASFIGVIMLVGIVVNNAIVLIDYINQLRKEGMERDQAILEAGPKRLRPILMTSLTTILGLLPLALATGEGTEIQTPMSLVVIGGLISSTFLTLVVIPPIYTMFDNLRHPFKRRKEKKLLSKQEENPQ